MGRTLPVCVSVRSGCTAHHSILSEEGVRELRQTAAKITVHILSVDVSLLGRPFDAYKVDFVVFSTLNEYERFRRHTLRTSLIGSQYSFGTLFSFVRSFPFLRKFLLGV